MGLGLYSKTTKAYILTAVPSLQLPEVSASLCLLPVLGSACDHFSGHVPFD